MQNLSLDVADNRYVESFLNLSKTALKNQQQQNVNQKNTHIDRGKIGGGIYCN